MIIHRLKAKSGSAIDFVCGDSLAVMRGLKRGKIGVIVTSPPYNLGIKYEVYDDTIDRASYLLWTLDWLKLARDVLADDGSLFLNMGGKATDPIVPEFVLMKAIEAGWVLTNKFVWVKSIAVPVKTKKDTIKAAAKQAGFNENQTRALVKAFESIEGEHGLSRTFGHVKPLSASKRFANECHEMVYHFTKTGDFEADKLAIGVPYEDESNLDRGTRGQNGNVRCRGNTWFLRYDTIQSSEDERPHPASFPVALAERCLRFHGVHKKPITFDPFAGIGSTALASANLGLDHIAVELGPNTVEWAVKRLVTDAGATASSFDSMAAAASM